MGVLAGSEVVKVARHCMYLPEGSPDVIGLFAVPRSVQLGVAASLANEVSEALTSKVMSVLLGSVSSQNRASHLL